MAAGMWMLGSSEMRCGCSDWVSGLMNVDERRAMNMTNSKGREVEKGKAGAGLKLVVADKPG